MDISVEKYRAGHQNTKERFRLSDTWFVPLLYYHVLTYSNLEVQNLLSDSDCKLFSAHLT